MTEITGYEPRLSLPNSRQRGLWRLSPRHIATMLNVLPSEAVSLPAIEAALNSSDFYARSAAAKRLVKRTDRDARLVLQRVLQSGDAPARANVARHLYGLTWFAAEPLLRTAFEDNDARVREGAVYSLCQMGTLQAYQFLIEVLSEEEDDYVLGAPALEWGLHGRRDPLAVDVLALSLQVTDPDIRAKVLDTLSSTHLPNAIPVVRAVMLQDHDFNVIYNAALSYVELAGEACIGDFAELFMQPHQTTRLEAMLRGFFHATNYSQIALNEHQHIGLLIDALYQCMQHSEMKVRRQAIFCLAWIKDPRVPGLIYQMYQVESNAETQAHILRVAVSLMVEGSETWLAEAPESPVEAVRNMANKIISEQLQNPSTPSHPQN